MRENTSSVCSCRMKSSRGRRRLPTHSDDTDETSSANTSLSRRLEVKRAPGVVLLGSREREAQARRQILHASPASQFRQKEDKKMRNGRGLNREPCSSCRGRARRPRRRRGTRRTSAGCRATCAAPRTPDNESISQIRLIQQQQKCRGWRIAMDRDRERNIRWPLTSHQKRSGLQLGRTLSKK